ncbi:uncharacterized protein B0T15DRAFT_126813 [Chaetomium strumarium]|uniref:Uncharacterized protein n=1 Tax=Chaetomium strumarium TaxID=1170767 RepID=A0AAJ0H021_9PEZI|nr:hypothetical protein B0T15DRAFT_126813 [Chaetomium strumarium]
MDTEFSFWFNGLGFEDGGELTWGLEGEAGKRRAYLGVYDVQVVLCGCGIYTTYLGRQLIVRCCVFLSTSCNIIILVPSKPEMSLNWVRFALGFPLLVCHTMPCHHRKTDKLTYAPAFARVSLPIILFLSFLTYTSGIMSLRC